MRFLAGGVNIPDELLEERDSGNVVFLCGAGVSRGAGMPDFLGLATDVVAELGAPEHARSRAMLAMWTDEKIPEPARPPLDQMFNLLQDEYAPAEIDYLIAKRLRPKSGVSLSNHEMILRLSKSADGKPQIVTTNFDTLFEKAAGRKTLKIYAAPTLPDLADRHSSLKGLVYLHGRTEQRIKRGERRQAFVVSSSDFGRAYLAEGWATRFMRDLFDKYIVVLLGYTANDPPVRYLLQGLHTGRIGSHNPIFAFDGGTEEEVRQRWQDSGIQALAYPSSDGKHVALWDTLSAWAERADDHLAWRRKVIELSRNGPGSLAPHERGQVASLVRTERGAGLFADAEPPPTGEWLCVFDSTVRYGDIGFSLDDLQPNFDPMDEYGLDDDPSRPLDRFPPIFPGDDLLSLRSTDISHGAPTRLAGTGAQFMAVLPPRLDQLARWIARVVPEPTVAWWVARQSGLHPDLLARIEYHFDEVHAKLPNLAYSTWVLLIEKFRRGSDDVVGGDWDNTVRRMEVEGWSNGVLRALEQVTKPYLTTECSLDFNGSQPPSEDWAMLNRLDIAEFKVAFPGYHKERPMIPDRELPAIYEMIRRHLVFAAGLLADAAVQDWKTWTFYEENQPGPLDLDDASVYFLWFRDLFDRMVNTRPERVKADVSLWPTEEPFFFDKLRVYAWTSLLLFSAKEVVDDLLKVSNDAFWNRNHRRELLWLLRSRWSDLHPDDRKGLEQRLVKGPARYDDEPQKDYKRRRSMESATTLGWLTKQGCELGEKTRNALPRLRRVDPRWSSDWDETADCSCGDRAGTGRMDDDPTPLVEVPICQIIPLARRLPEVQDGTYYRPYTGLVSQYPRRAVAALSCEARRNQYPIRFWRATLEEWPATTSRRLVWLFGTRLTRLPSIVSQKLKTNSFQWLREHFSELVAQDRPRALGLFDAFLERSFEDATGKAESETREKDTVGAQRDRPNRTFHRAIGGVAGMAAELLFDLLKSQDPTRDSGLPLEIKTRFERLIALPDGYAQDAMCIVASKLPLLDSVDPGWTRGTVVPWFDLTHPASGVVWNGFLHNGRLPQRDLFLLLKPHFLSFFRDTWGSILDAKAFERLHQVLVDDYLQRRDDTPYLSRQEARRALQETDARGRAHGLRFAVLFLTKNSKQWRRCGKSFLEKLWPRESRCQTVETSLLLLHLANKAGDDFPAVVEAVVPLLVPIPDIHTVVHGFTSQEGSELPRRFPAHALRLINKVVPDVLVRRPDHRELNALLDTIAEAKPSLRQSDGWRRLKDIAPHR